VYGELVRKRLWNCHKTDYGVSEVIMIDRLCVMSVVSLFVY